MKFEFENGIPEACINWLWENVGRGNGATVSSIITVRDSDKFAWFYERIAKLDTDSIYFVPAITVKDEKLALMFALRWS